ncbi:MAG: NitT/TauT family transport system substrate-binding protein [Verrucomicrobiales bacterium]|jgi:NitT/TauT family transport system substrate-binding protein
MKKTNHTIKRIVLALSASILTVWLASCGGSDPEPDTTETPASEPSPAPKTTEAAKPEPKPEPAPIPKADPTPAKTPLKIAYSDWPGWVAWEIAIKKGWFKEAGVEIQFEWMDYVASMEAYGAGKLDACSMTNGDALVTGATAKPSICVLINDYSNGNDMLIAKEGLNTLADLKGKKVALEEGFVPHLLVLKGLADAGMAASDIEIVNTPTNDTPQVLKSDEISAICAWQPSSGTALKQVPGSKPIYSSKDSPGLIYDCLFVSPESYKARRADWAKVVSVWYRVVDFIKDEDKTDEVLAILSARVKLSPDEYEPFLDGTYILSLDEALKIWGEADGLESIYGSTKYSDDFNVKFEVYEKPVDFKTYLDPSLTKEYAASKK